MDIICRSLCYREWDRGCGYGYIPIYSFDEHRDNTVEWLDGTMRIYVDDIEQGFFKLGNSTEVVASESMCREVSLPNPQRTFLGMFFNRNIVKCIPYLYI